LYLAHTPNTPLLTNFVSKAPGLSVALLCDLLCARTELKIKNSERTLRTDGILQHCGKIILLLMLLKIDNRQKAKIEKGLCQKTFSLIRLIRRIRRIRPGRTQQ